jgi:hypothetical protein
LCFPVIIQSRKFLVIIKHRKKMTDGWFSDGAKVAAVVTAIGLLVCGFASLSSSGTEAGRKKMKAPGQNDKIIYRDVFEGDPKTYFRDLHKK